MPRRDRHLEPQGQKAVDTTLDREAAIKILPAAFAEDPERLSRFEREAKLLASLSHPNVAAVYGLHETDGIRFLAMELVTGGTLTDEIARGLPPARVVEIAARIADGLAAAHREHVIHRDLKPDNIAIDRDGRPKILDFGLAKVSAFASSPDEETALREATTTREDIDADRIAYYGLSWGGAMGAILPAIEPRIRANILYVAGMNFQRALPEADQINYVTRVRQPTLILNGELDFFFPVETSQRPLFELLGTPPENKKRLIFPGGHSVPRPEMMKQSLQWLDQYLGPVGGQ
jgi:serine/threonine protein kinase